MARDRVGKIADGAATLRSSVWYFGFPVSRYMKEEEGTDSNTRLQHIHGYAINLYPLD